MKNLKYGLCLIVTIFSMKSFSSVAFMENTIYRCSDGKSYNVLRILIGGWPESSWKFVGFCEKGILKSNSYSGRFLNPSDSSPEVAECINQESQELVKCYNEYTSLNADSGKGKIPNIKNFDGTTEIPCEDQIDRAESEVKVRRRNFEFSLNDGDRLLLDESIRNFGLVVFNCNEKKQRDNSKVSKQ